MGQPVVHFEVVGKDAEKLRKFYGELAGWNFDVYDDGPTDYGVVSREENTNLDGVGIGGGVGDSPEGYGGHVTFYIEVPDVGAALDQVEKLGGTKMMGPDSPMEGLTIGLFNDPEGHVVGLVQGAG
jgi:uncharacterized protein